MGWRREGVRGVQVLLMCIIVIIHGILQLLLVLMVMLLVLSMVMLLMLVRVLLLVRLYMGSIAAFRVETAVM